MPTWPAVIFGVIASGVLCLIVLAFALRIRQPDVLVAAVLAAMLGPLLWDLILRHAGGDFFVDAPGYVFPVSLEDTGSGVFATAIAAVLLGLGPLRRAEGQRVAIVSLVSGAAALLVDIYLY
jgi:hypothetical protein